MKKLHFNTWTENFHRYLLQEAKSSPNLSPSERVLPGTKAEALHNSFISKKNQNASFRLIESNTLSIESVRCFGL